ncbi:uncharacterized protein LOC132714412, partial [Ruditapes philippinarum]|uniref:uncharacterized protein LOC132714412 n=1 Tax=Ruditapes philippinarum TaxID=129788 RepID=UPI00295B5B11
MPSPSDSPHQKTLYGEIGLDRTEPEMSWDLQEKTMVRLLQFSMPVRPVILHMRDGTDQHAGEDQVAALQRVPDNRLLLETDDPYFKKSAVKASTPAFLGDIGDVVSKHR